MCSRRTPGFKSSSLAENPSGGFPSQTAQSTTLRRGCCRLNCISRNLIGHPCHQASISSYISIPSMVSKCVAHSERGSLNARAHCAPTLLAPLSCWALSQRFLCAALTAPVTLDRSLMRATCLTCVQPVRGCLYKSGRLLSAVRSSLDLYT